VSLVEYFEQWERQWRTEAREAVTERAVGYWRGKVDAIEQVINVLRQPSTPTLTREDVAAYLLDRADQYDNSNGRWVPLADAAHALMEGAVEEALAHGELQEEDLRRRVRGWAKKGPR